MIPDFHDQINTIALNAKKSALNLQSISIAKINEVLHNMAKLLSSESSLIQSENQKDLENARLKDLSSVMIDRLTLSDKVISSMINGLNEVIQLRSPIGKRFDERVRPNGLIISKMKVPIGVVGIIYESRPNVTVDAAAICLKSHNAVILRGGSEAFHSNMVLVNLFSQAIRTAGLPEFSIQMLPSTDRKAVELLLKKDEYIDLIIPRGGESLIRMVVENSRIPVIKHYKGVCHIYVSSLANIDKSLPIIINAKVQRPGVCNAMETLLLDVNISEANRALIIKALTDHNITLFGDFKTMELSPEIKIATEDDWKAEYLDLRLAVKTVNNIQEAIDHINTYGSHHTDSILTESKQEAEVFFQQVDSASVMVNASTRFADGGEYGMGCEIGISTDKLHSRGPMGIEDLTTYKWIVEGNGQIRY